MTKKDEKTMVGIAESEIEKFVEEWKEKPYLWESETDVHAELYTRIKSSLHNSNFCPIEYVYEKDMVEKEYFDRVYCKPKINNTSRVNYPDIVIYKDTGENHKVGDKENEPMLWACEIKYFTDWSSELSKGAVKKDIANLKCLLRRKKGGVDYACYLILQRRKRRKSECGYNRIIRPYLQLNKGNKIQGVLKNLKKTNGKLKSYCYSIDYKKNTAVDK